MRMGHWIFDENRTPKLVDLYTWAFWFETGNRVVRQEWVGNMWVSTVFLGIDHNFSNEGPPILWETMVFSNRKVIDQIPFRCAGSWEQAEAMHEEVMKKACELESITYKPIHERNIQT